MEKNTLRVLVTIPIEPEYEARLREAGPGAEFRFKPAVQSFTKEPLNTGPLTREDAAWAQVILGNVELDFLREAENLLWLQTSSAGVEEYLRPDALREGVLLTNCTGAYGLAISEHMLGMLLVIFKKLELYRDAQRREQWASLGSVRSVWGSTVLVLGMGDIGGEFAKRCKALGAKVIGVRRTAGEIPPYADEVRLPGELDELLPQADVVACALPGTAATRNLLDRRRIGLMKEGAVLLNVGRGSSVDTEALCDALEAGRLSGAGLDVTDPEPLPAGHRLWRIPTAVVTPHISGFYHLHETYERILAICAENLRRFLSGKPLKNQIDFEAGYRKKERSE